MLATNARQYIIFGFLALWAFIYIFGFSIENALRSLSERDTPWPWELRGGQLRDLVIIPSIALGLICGFFYWRERQDTSQADD